MAEHGTIPEVSHLRRWAVGGLRAFCTPLLADDYLDLVNPLWSTRELRGRIERIEPETSSAATVVIRPGHKWPGHQAGQYLRIGVTVGGVIHWRAYSLTSPAERAPRCITITPKLVEGGVVSSHLLRDARPGEVIRLGEVEGTFILPDPPPRSLLFISAGSGITPIASMLSSLQRQGAVVDVVHIHSAQTERDVIFGRWLRGMDAAHAGFRLHLQLTGRMGRFSPPDLDALCPDWRGRHTFASGPSDLLDGLVRHWRRNGLPDLLEIERFQPAIGEAEVGGKGGTIKFTKSGVEVDCARATPILNAGEEAGVLLPSGCRMGICHTCVGELRHGAVRDLRTGKVHGAGGEMVRTCVNAPEGPIGIAF